MLFESNLANLLKIEMLAGFRIDVKALTLRVVTLEDLAYGKDVMPRIHAMHELRQFDQLHPGFRKKLKTMIDLVHFDHPLAMVTREGLFLAALGRQTFIGFTQEEKEMVDAIKFFQL